MTLGASAADPFEMDLLPLLIAARTEAVRLDDADELAARLADLSLGEHQEARRAIVEALSAGYPQALRAHDQRRASAIASGLTARPEREAALALWRAVCDLESDNEQQSRWHAGAVAAASSDALLVVAAIRSESRVEQLAVSLCRDGREISCWIDQPSEPYLTMLRRIPTGIPVVGYDLPRILALLPEDISAHLAIGPVADLALTAGWLRDQGRLDLPDLGLQALARAAAVPLPNESIGARVEAASGVWFGLLRPRLLD